jgi:hypothetical protein
VSEVTAKVSEASAAYCGRCGNPMVDGDHAGCVRALALEPPRYCARCRRRLIVQVLPTGWTARCSAHGDLR